MAGLCERRIRIEDLARDFSGLGHHVPVPQQIAQAERREP